MKRLMVLCLLASPSAFGMCGSEAIEGAEDFAKYVRGGHVGRVEIVKESSDDLVYTYIVENTRSGDGGFTEVFEVVTDLDSNCIVNGLRFIGYK